METYTVLTPDILQITNADKTIQVVTKTNLIFQQTQITKDIADELTRHNAWVTAQNATLTQVQARLANFK